MRNLSVKEIEVVNGAAINYSNWYQSYIQPFINNIYS